MVVPGLVLGAFLLSMLGIIAALFVGARERIMRRESALCESTIDTAARLDAALAIQRSLRIAELQRRVAAKSRWPYALAGLALIMQLAALAADHLAHPSIAVMCVAPAGIVFTVVAARRRRAQRELSRYFRNQAT
jgi:Flp pilus assembly protein TadB